jgi:hypothetical protein
MFPTPIQRGVDIQVYTGKHAPSACYACASVNSPDIHLKPVLTIIKTVEIHKMAVSLITEPSLSREFMVCEMNVKAKIIIRSNLARTMKQIKVRN